MHLSVSERSRERDRDDVVSVSSARSTPSFSLRLRRKSALHFRDDLSEYSNPSNWGDWKGPLSISDYRFHAEGLQPRRTVGEALLRAQHLRHAESDNSHSRAHCQSCFRPRLPAKLRRDFGSSRRKPSHSQTLLFTWPEVQYIVLVPTEEQKGPCLLAISTLRTVRDEGTREREWLLQAGGKRARACWSLELVAAILRHHANNRGGSPSGFYGHGRTAVGLSLPLFMDMSRIACEVGRFQPSIESMETLIAVLDMLADGRRPGCVESVLPTPPHLPIAALRRFRDAVKQAHSDFFEWQRWREVVLFIRSPDPLDETIWQRHVVPFLKPKELFLPSNQEDLAHEKLVLKKYPDFVEVPLTSAAERCRRTLSS
mmetsp:Transcript_10541/g.23968  ORF Transcript_10541/g.23968 Transcript_10541/m.23968 type:complete len:371 (+) Transcript_10541:116-1228(+)